MSSRGGVESTSLEAKDTKKSKAKAKDRLSEDRPIEAKDKNARGQGPRTQLAGVLQKKSSQIFREISSFLQKKKKKEKKGLRANFSAKFQAFFKERKGLRAKNRKFSAKFQAINKVITLARF